MIMEEGLRRNIMLVPGRVFVPRREDGGRPASPYMRASYSLAPVEKFDEAFRRLAELVREERAKQVREEEV